MAAPRPKKTTVVKKKPPVKKTPVKKPDVKSPAETRKSISRKQVGTSRPARGDLGTRAQYLKYGPTQPQGPEAPTYREKIGPVKPNAAAKVGVARGLIKKIPVVGAAAGFIMDAAPAGEGSTKDKYSTLKKKYSSAIGPKLKIKNVKGVQGGMGIPAYGIGLGGEVKGTYLPNKGKNWPSMSGYNNTGRENPAIKKLNSSSSNKASGFGKRISEGAKFERLRASRAALGSKSSDSAGSPFSNGKGNASLPKVKSGVSNTTATAAAAASSGGGSQAANVAKAGGKAKAKVGKQTKYQRNETAMEQKRSSSKPKKSIFSLFRKG
jgi:hypothetical protein